jgi:hypothetical protein
MPQVPGANTAGPNADMGDWALSVIGDAFGDAYQSTPLLISTTDLELMNGIGYLAPVPKCANGLQIAAVGGSVSVRPGAMVQPYQNLLLSDDSFSPVSGRSGHDDIWHGAQCGDDAGGRQAANGRRFLLTA